jgi:hypothetical protein
MFLRPSILKDASPGGLLKVQLQLLAADMPHFSGSDTLQQYVFHVSVSCRQT